MPFQDWTVLTNKINCLAQIHETFWMEEVKMQSYAIQKKQLGFWCKIWPENVKHNYRALWLHEIEEDFKNQLSICCLWTSWSLMELTDVNYTPEIKKKKRHYTEYRGSENPISWHTVGIWWREMRSYWAEEGEK